MTGPLTLEGIPVQGKTSSTAIARCGSGLVVIKRTRPPFLPWARHEHKVLDALAASGLPIQIPCYAGERVHDGTPEAWLVTGYIAGRRLTDELSTTGIGVEDREAHMKEYGRVLRRIHDCPIPAGIRTGATSWLDGLFVLADQYVDEYAREHAQDESAAKAVRQREQLIGMKRSRPPAPSLTLIHGDYTTDHALFEDRNITGIVDWATATVGDPMYDMAQALYTPPMESARDFKMGSGECAFFGGYGIVPPAIDVIRYYQDLYDLGGRGWSIGPQPEMP